MHEKAREQFKEAIRIKMAARTTRYNRHTGDMLCVCRRRIPIEHMHKCYHCGMWFCPKCAKEHFGERGNVPAHKEKK